MAVAHVNGLDLAYEVFGEGRPWIISPGGRFSKDDPGIREMARALAEHGNRVVIWDRPNCGASDVCFEGPSESEMQADALIGLVRELDLGPTVIAGGSGGSRVSLIAAARYPDETLGAAFWWMSGGRYGLYSLGYGYCRDNIITAWKDGMEAVADLAEWSEMISKNPRNRDLIIAQDRERFVETLQDWMVAYCPCGDSLVPGIGDDAVRAYTRPSLVFRSGASDLNHTRETSERLAALLGNSRMVEPPWGDREWLERQEARNTGTADGLFIRWPLLVPQLAEWADEVLPQG